MTQALNDLQQVIAPLKHHITNHKVYGAIKTPEDLKVFMSYHVYAVWDFMSLLKSLQNKLTCTTVPWFPVGSANTRFLINEIVVGEECDIDQNGLRKSHYELYLEAMQGVGADISGITTFTEVLKATGDFEQAFEQAKVPQAARDFVNFTFGVIKSDKDYLQAAIFTFGREDLIPEMFHSIVNDINQQFKGSATLFKYYLDRHIEVDGDHHSELAIKMMLNLCGNDVNRWKDSERLVIRCLEQRLALWDAAYQEITATA
jgi:hypothetical protein